jgi:Carboxypeptidase regulatory-like domain
MRTALICVSLCLITNQVAAQAEQSKPGQLAATGSVVGSDGKPQPGVPLRVEGPTGKTITITDAKGKWSLYNLSPGRYKIWMTPVGKDETDAPINFDVKPKSWMTWGGEGAAAVYKAPDLKFNSYSDRPM